MPIRFHLDENVDRVVADGLKRRGVDVTTALDCGLVGATDMTHMQFALSEDRVIFTHDADFLRMARKGLPHAGIAFCHAKDRLVGDIILALTALVRHQTAEELRGQVRFI